MSEEYGCRRIDLVQKRKQPRRAVPTFAVLISGACSLRLARPVKSQNATVEGKDQAGQRDGI